MTPDDKAATELVAKADADAESYYLEQLRDDAAIRIVAAMVAAGQRLDKTSPEWRATSAERAYEWADAIVAARRKSTEKAAAKLETQAQSAKP